MKKLFTLMIAVFSFSSYSVNCWTVKDFGATGSFGASTRNNIIDFDVSGRSLKINSDKIPRSTTLSLSSAEFSIEKDECESIIGCYVKNLAIKIGIFDHSTNNPFIIYDHISNVYLSLSAGNYPGNLLGSVFKIHQLEKSNVYLEAFVGNCR